MIIIEGPNGVGKTTLAKKIVNRYNFQYKKENVPDESGYSYYIKKLLNYDNYDIVIDRFHIGENVYPIIKMDGRNILEDYQQFAIEQIINNLNGILIFCCTNKKFIKDVYDNRGEDFINFNDVTKEIKLFKYNIKKSNIKNIILYDVEKHTYDDIFKQIDKYLNQINYLDYRKYKGNGCIINNPIMLIGEKFNKKNLNIEKFAFSSWKGASDYLMSSLYKVKKDFYFTNVIKTNNENKNLSFLKNEIKDISPVKIIALGKKSERYLQKLNVDYSYIFHPQYWKRFYFYEKDLYTSMFIKEINNI